MAKKIRFIKENPLFDWKVGDIQELKSGSITIACPTIEELFIRNYIEFVEDEPNLDEVVERVFKIKIELPDHCESSTEMFYLTKAEAYYRLSLIADALRGNLEGYFFIIFNKKENRYEVDDYMNAFYAYDGVSFTSEAAAQSVIDNPKARPILDALYK